MAKCRLRSLDIAVSCLGTYKPPNAHCFKLLSANRFIGASEYVRSSPDIIRNGFKSAGIFGILNMI